MSQTYSEHQNRLVFARSVQDFLQKDLIPVDDLQPGSECPVCTSTYSADDGVKAVRLPGCWHIFCRACITQWAESSQPNAGTCPSCRTALYVATPRRNAILPPARPLEAVMQEQDSAIFRHRRFRFSSSPTREGGQGADAEITPVELNPAMGPTRDRVMDNVPAPAAPRRNMQQTVRRLARRRIEAQREEEALRAEENALGARASLRGL